VKITKNMHNLILVFLFLFSFSIKAQDFITPNYETKQDYIDRKDKVLEACDWLISNSLFDNKRQEVNTYLLTWVEGSPMVKVKLTEYVLKLTDKNPEFLLVFISGWVKATLQEKKTTSYELNNFATNTILDFYQTDKTARRDADIEKLLKLKKKNKLEEWLREQI
jgi:hypothetical protein